MRPRWLPPRDRLARGGFWLAPGLAAGFVTGGHPWLGLGAMAAAHAPLLAGTLWPNSPWFGPVVREVDERGWLLTIDDGPDPQDTPALLACLDRHRLKAMFFFVGEKAARQRSLVAEVIAAGHAIGNHSWSHPERRWWRIGPTRAGEEIDRCQEVLGEILGEAPAWFRPPVGMANPWVHAALRERGLRLMGWNVRGLDGDPRRPLAQVRETLAEALARRGRDGALILLHEGHHQRSYRAADLLDETIGLLRPGVGGRRGQRRAED